MKSSSNILLWVLAAVLGLFVLYRTIGSSYDDLLPSNDCTNSRKDTHGLVCVSNKLWGMILREDDKRWKSIRASVRKFRDLPSYRQAVWVPTFSCPMEQRIGELADGGKWVCFGSQLGASKEWNPPDDRCLVIGFGIGGKYGFETELLKKTSGRCEVHLFDPNARRWKAPNVVGLNTYEYGLTTKKLETEKFKSYDNILKMLKHEKRTVNLLKMDIELAEYDVIPEIAVLPKSQRPQQITIEVHWHPEQNKKTKGWEQRVLRIFDRNVVMLREAGYVLFHMETNFFAPSCTEFSFLRLDSRTYR